MLFKMDDFDDNGGLLGSLLDGISCANCHNLQLVCASLHKLHVFPLKVAVIYFLSYCVLYVLIFFLWLLSLQLRMPYLNEKLLPSFSK
jgi:hypothetical protein